MENKKYPWYCVVLDLVWDGIDIVLPALFEIAKHLTRMLLESI